MTFWPEKAWKKLHNSLAKYAANFWHRKMTCTWLKRAIFIRFRRSKDPWPHSWGFRVRFQPQPASAGAGKARKRSLLLTFQDRLKRAKNSRFWCSKSPCPRSWGLRIRIRPQLVPTDAGKDTKRERKTRPWILTLLSWLVLIEVSRFFRSLRYPLTSRREITVNPRMAHVAQGHQWPWTLEYHF